MRCKSLNANPGLLASVEQVSIEDAGGKIGIPNRKDIAGILETLYQTRRDSATRKLALPNDMRAFAKDYSISTVGSKHWIPLLTKMEDEIMADLEPFVVPPVREGIKRIGIMTTFNTSNVGIATYSAMLKEALEKKGIDVFILAEANDPMKISSKFDENGVAYCWHRNIGIYSPFTEAVEGSELTFCTFSMSGRFSERPT